MKRASGKQNGRRACWIGIAGGLLTGTVLLYGTILLLSRHVDHDWDSEFLALHDRWNAKGIKPGGLVADADAPPPATDW